MKQRIQNLRKQIDNYNAAYYAGKPTVEDAAFDAIFSKLEQLEKEFPEFHDPNSPTTKVGSETLNKFNKKEHIAPALSVRTVTEQKINQLLKKYGTLLAETKYDGVCVGLVYNNGQLTYALSRGNGQQGADITKNIRTIKNIPLKINNNSKQTEIIGEVVLPLAEYEKVKNKYPNPQAAAAAIVRLKKSSETAKYKLQFIAHTWHPEEKYNTCSINFHLNKLGFKTPNYAIVDTPEFIENAINFLPADKKYPADGIVFKIDDYTTKQKLKNNTRYFGWAWAVKPEISETAEIFDIHYSVSAKGNLTPVALFVKPIKIGGNQVIKASLHNLKTIQKLNVNTGAVVQIKFTGKVPEIIKTLQPTGKHIPPVICPECKQPITVTNRLMQCTNTKSCPAKGKIPDVPINQKYAFLFRPIGTWGAEHAIALGKKLNITVKRTKKGSPYLNLYFNAKEQLAKFTYLMTANSNF